MTAVTNRNTIGKSELLCSAIQQQLLDNGVLREITTSVRSRLLLSLLNDEPSSGEARAKAIDEEEMAMSSLMYDYLQQKGMAHTLSVFAAESNVEQSLGYPLSSVEAIKTLGLQDVWEKCAKENGGKSVDLLQLLQTMAQDRVADERASKSVQTDIEVVPRPRGDSGDEGDERKKDNVASNCGGSKGIEQRLIDMERECQQRMRHELNERLRLSAKKQASYATKRVEQMHQEALQSLRTQMEEERAQAQRRQEELIATLNQQKLAAEKQSNDVEQKVQALSLEKQSLQNELASLNERVQEMQQRRIKEMTQEQSAIEERERDLRQQMIEVSLQRDNMKAKELRLASLEEDRDELVDELQNLQRERANALERQQSSHEEAQAKLERKFLDAKADAEAARHEAAGLRSLLKSQKAALESLSFRELGKTGAARISLPSPAVYNRHAVGATNQFEPRAKSVAEETMTRATTCPSLRVATSTNRVIRTASRDDFRQQLPATTTSGTRLQEGGEISAGTLDMRKDKEGNVAPAAPEDPPCTSAEDPPEMTQPTKTNPIVDDRVVANSSMDVVVGEQFVLDLSGITEDVFSEKVAAIPSASHQIDGEQTNSERVASDVEGVGKPSGTEEEGEVDTEKEATADLPMAAQSTPDEDSTSNKEDKGTEDIALDGELAVPLLTDEDGQNTSPSIDLRDASETMASNCYSESFHDPDGGNKQGIDQPGINNGSFSGSRGDHPDQEETCSRLPASPSSSSAGSGSGYDDYSESFCSDVNTMA